MKLLIVGASGLVGWNFARVARAAGHEVAGTYATHPSPDLIELRLENIEAVRRLLEDFRPDAVIYCAAWSWVDGCEGDPGRAFLENAGHPARVADLAHRGRAKFLSFSTSYVFDGRDGPYDETAATHPLSVYGKSKLEGERRVLEATEGEALIARTMGVYGEEPQQKNFVYQVVRALRAGKPMTVPSDQSGNASYAGDVAAISLKLVEQGANGIWNVAGPDPNLNRRDFALRIAREYGLDPGLLRFVPTAELGQPAPRPRQGGLVITRAVKATSIAPSPWTPITIPGMPQR
jgi:dTDP-4-dehydrorhamnose reductase